MVKNRSSGLAGEGCGFLLFTCLFACLMLLVNGGLTLSIYSWLAPGGPKWLRDPRVAQSLMYVGPVVLLVIQWWLLDTLFEGFWPRRRASRKGTGG